MAARLRKRAMTSRTRSFPIRPGRQRTTKVRDLRCMGSQAIKEERRSELFAGAGSFVLHTILAMIAGSILMVATGVTADSVLGNVSPWYTSVADSAGLLNPLLWAPGIVLGFLVYRRISTRTACWVWVVGVAWLAFAVWDSIHYYDPRYNQGCSVRENIVNAFFIMNARRCCGGDSTLSGLFFTMPAIGSATYSVGACAAMGLKKKRSEPLQPDEIARS